MGQYDPWVIWVPSEEVYVHLCPVRGPVASSRAKGRCEFADAASARNFYPDLVAEWGGVIGQWAVSPSQYIIVGTATRDLPDSSQSGARIRVALAVTGMATSHWVQRDARAYPSGAGEMRFVSRDLCEAVCDYITQTLSADGDIAVSGITWPAVPPDRVLAPWRLVGAPAVTLITAGHAELVGEAPERDSQPAPVITTRERVIQLDNGET